MNDDEERQHMLDYEDGSETELNPPFSSRTQHGLTRSEMIQGMANRLMYSNFYIALYLCLGILIYTRDLVCLGLQERYLPANIHSSPSLTFIVFEAIINFAMIAEVTIRLLALRRTYWQSIWNIIDTILVVLCAVTLIVLATGCSASERKEAIFDTLLLVIRNCFQFFRLFMMAKKNQYSIQARTTRIDFSDLPEERNTSIDLTRDQRLDQSFLDDDSDFEQDRI
ncbi:hypothetical protein [Absidia glauca]|uniref:Ion transport domain-containing protein n=1 Tax=Absidia glauca TaxID=4829 RepID=A0A170AP50_ABSGL|nr:hypothetical protein [Absidia glauca]